MGDLYVHIRMKECCRATLQGLDKQKKKANFSGGMLAIPSWVRTLGDQSIDAAREAIVLHESVSGGKLERVVRAICTRTSEQHAALHEGKGETEEGAFWHEMAAACSGKPAQAVVARKGAVPASFSRKLSQADAAQLANTTLDALKGALEKGARGAFTGVVGGLVKDAAVARGAEMLAAFGHKDAAAAVSGINSLLGPVVSGKEAAAATRALSKVETQAHDAVVADLESRDGAINHVLKEAGKLGGLVAKPFEWAQEGGEFVLNQFSIPIAK
ncbi:MAG: hypothetical protein ABJE95_10675 [Byssovorax sp.]